MRSCIVIIIIQYKSVTFKSLRVCCFILFKKKNYFERCFVIIIGIQRICYVKNSPKGELFIFDDYFQN